MFADATHAQDWSMIVARKVEQWLMDRVFPWPVEQQESQLKE
jgi:hypothetical protein